MLTNCDIFATSSIFKNTCRKIKSQNIVKMTLEDYGYVDFATEKDDGTMLVRHSREFEYTSDHLANVIRSVKTGNSAVKEGNI
jgi:hypothetical protein